MSFKTLNQIRQAIEAGEPQNRIEEYWMKYQSGLQYKTWLNDKHDEYNRLYPPSRDMTYDEYIASHTSDLDVGTGNIMDIGIVSESQYNRWSSKPQQSIAVEISFDAWIAKQTFEFNPDQAPKMDQDLINEINRNYLTETDWYIIRQQETGISVPDAILAKRQAARQAIIKTAK